jgi:hypothetical protein
VKLLKVHLFGASEKSVSKSSKLMQSKWLSTFFVNLHQIRFVDFNICIIMIVPLVYNEVGGYGMTRFVMHCPIWILLSVLTRWYIVKDCTDLWPVTNMTLPPLNCLDSIVLLVALKQWFLYGIDNSHFSHMFFMKDQLHEMFLSVSATQHHCHDVVFSDVLTVQSEDSLT